jgi:hypothetical protein
MRSRGNRHPKLIPGLRSGLLLIAAALALLTIGLGTALAEGEEEGPTTTDPVVVPEAEAPPTSNPATAPVEPATSPAPTATAPVSKPSESGSSGGSTKHTSTPTTSGGSGGSKSAPTHTDNSVAGGGGSSPSSGGGGSSNGGGGGSSHSAAPTQSSSSAPTSSLDLTSDSSVEKATSALSQVSGRGGGRDKKSRQEAVSHLGEAVGKALLGNGVQVVKAKPHQDVVPDFVPLPAKNRTLYFLLILVVLAIASLVVWIQFRGPRASRRRKAHIDHRTASAVRLTPAERLRARQWNPEHARARKARPPRRKAA